MAKGTFYSNVLLFALRLLNLSYNEIIKRVQYACYFLRVLSQVVPIADSLLLSGMVVERSFDFVVLS